MKESKFTNASFQSSSLDRIKERRRRLLYEKQQRNLKHLWQIFIFSSSAAFLGLIYIYYGWSPIDLNSIYIKGSNKINPNMIVIAGNITLPIPLLKIDPKPIEYQLLKNLPIKDISINRRLFPPILEIDLEPKQSFANATRTGKGGKEAGFLDLEADWISVENSQYLDPPISSISIEGWLPMHKESIRTILKHRFLLGTPIKKIILNPNGEISIQAEDFERIELGTNNQQMVKQMEAIGNLIKTLPLDLLNKEGVTIDIRNPSKPELQVKEL